MSKQKSCILKNGQSLVEAVVAIAIAALTLTGLISAMTFSLANTQSARNKALATKSAQEAFESIRSQRDISWTNLSGKLVGAGPTTYCINNLDIANWTSPPCSPITGTNITREVTLTGDSSQITAVMTVSMPEGGKTITNQFTTQFTNWYAPVGSPLPLPTPTPTPTPVATPTPTPTPLPTPTPSPTPTPTPTPSTPASSPLLIEGSSKSCNDICGVGKCLSFGTDLGATNGLFSYYNGSSTCTEAAANCSSIMYVGRSCSAQGQTHTARWIWCKCSI